MQVALFLAADFAKIDANGKLDILGVFNRINAVSFPAKHRTLFLVIRIIATFGEYDLDHPFKLLFVDEDGEEQQPTLEGIMRFEKPPTGTQVQADTILQLGDLPLPRQGRYEFRLLINQDVKGILPLEAAQISQPKA
jgi:hypothetical protein